VGALFVGKFFDQNYTTELGQFSVILDHNGENIEVCGGETELIRFKLIMSFSRGGGWFWWDRPVPGPWPNGIGMIHSARMAIAR